MSEEQKKNKFFDNLKKSLFSSEKGKEKSIEENIEKDTLGAMSTKAVNPILELEKVVEYQSVSNSEFLDEKFAENFVFSGGKFIFCQDEKELIHFLKSLKEENKWNHVYASEFELLDFLSFNNFQREEIGIKLEDSDAAISNCFSLSANDGVIILSPEQATNRRLVNFPKVHIIVAYKNQLKKDINIAISNFDTKYDGRLASILELHKGRPIAKANRKTLISAEGPQDVYLFYIDKDKID